MPVPTESHTAQTMLGRAWIYVPLKISWSVVSPRRGSHFTHRLHLISSCRRQPGRNPCWIRRDTDCISDTGA